MGSLLRYCLNMFIDLVVVTSFKRFISEKVYFLIILQKLQAVCFVPSVGEHIKGYLSSNGVGKPNIWELLLQSINKVLPNFRSLHQPITYVVILLELISLTLRTVPTDWTDINHSRPIFYKGSPLNGNIQLRQILQAEVDELLQLILSQEILNGLRMDTHVLFRRSSLFF